MPRNRMNMNFGWRFSGDFKPEYIRTDCKDTTFRLVDIPHTVEQWTRGYICEKQSQKICCYRKMFLLPAEMKNRRLVLHFEGVMGCTAAFVNGKPVAAHKGGFTPFECEISGAISEYLNDGENLLTVVVDSTEREDTAPFGSSDALHGGGIYREVWLEATDDDYIKDVYTRTRMEKDQWVLDIDGEISTAEKRDIKIYLFDGDKKLAAKFLVSENGCFSTEWRAAIKPEPWTPNNPKLYRLEINIGDAGEGDSCSRMIGFRQAEFRADGFFLNDERVMLTGLARNQLFAYAGSAMPKYAQRSDAELLKELGCNIVRTKNCPPDRHFLDACDELGLLLFEELPGHGFIGGAEWKECLLDNMRELILRDRSRTCVVLWGTRLEETPDDDSFYSMTNSLAAKLDPTRPTAGIRSVSKLAQIGESVFCYNDYSHNGENAGLEKKKNVYKPAAPYLITGQCGFRYPVRNEDDEKARTEQAIRCAKALDAAYGEAGICGIIGGDMSDYPVHSSRGGSDGLCCQGATDMFRSKKLAAYVYESQSDDHAVLEVSSALASGDYPGGVLGPVWVFTNCDSVRLRRNGKPVGEYKPSRRMFPNMPHPPILIDDFIGKLPCSEDGVEAKELANLKNVFFAMMKEGDIPPDSRLKSAMAYTDRVKISAEELVRLYNKYCAGKLGAATFTFEGIKDEKPVSVSVIEPVSETGMKIYCPKVRLLSSEAYDCTRIVLTAVDQNQNRLWHSSDAVSVDVDGSIELIGPRLFSLCAGSASFYVRTKGGKGAARVNISTESLGSHTIELDVSRIK